jgi:hypothetical protein
MRTLHWILLAALTSGSVALSFLGSGPSHPQVWDGIPLFFAAFGFVGCTVLIFVSKALEKAFLKQQEDYYEQHR